MQLDDGQRPRHEAGWDCLKIHIMQKIKNEIKEEVIMSIIIMKWSEAVFNVQYYKGLKAVWCYNVLNFLCLVVFEPPSGNCTRLPESLQNKIKKNEKIKKRETPRTLGHFLSVLSSYLLSPFTVTFFILNLFYYFAN